MGRRWNHRGQRTRADGRHRALSGRRLAERGHLRGSRRKRRIRRRLLSGRHHDRARRLGQLRRPLRQSGQHRARCTGLARKARSRSPRESAPRRSSTPARSSTTPLQRLAIPPPPYAGEYERLRRAVCGDGLLPWPAYAAARKANSTGEAARASSFEGLAAPLGGAPAQGWEPAGSRLSPLERETCGCAGRLLRCPELPRRGGRARRLRRGTRRRRTSAPGSSSSCRRPARRTSPSSSSPKRTSRRSSRPAGTTAAAELLFAALVGRNPDGQDPGRYAASAYFYDAPESNVQADGLLRRCEPPDIRLGHARLRAGVQRKHDRIPRRQRHHARRSPVGTPAAPPKSGPTSRRSSVRLIPVIGELAMEAKDGTLLPRSRPRCSARSRAGHARAAGHRPAESRCEENQYIPIPSICVGVDLRRSRPARIRIPLLAARHRRLRKAQHDRRAIPARCC